MSQGTDIPLDDLTEQHLRHGPPALQPENDSASLARRRSAEGSHESTLSHSSGTAVPSPPEFNDSGSAASKESPSSGFQKFWQSNVSCEVEFVTCRDHLALERTFLGYLRTAMTMSIIGTATAQLFVIGQQDTGFGYTLLGRPLAALCYFFSMGTMVLGAVRTWRQQRAMMHGTALASGFEIHFLGIGAFLLIFVFFIIGIAIDVVKDEHPDLPQ